MTVTSNLDSTNSNLMMDVDRSRCDLNTLLWFNRDNNVEKIVWRRRDVPRAGQLLKRAKIRFAAQLSETQMSPEALLVRSVDGYGHDRNLDVLVGWQEVLSISYNESTRVSSKNADGRAAKFAAMARLPFLGFSPPEE
jgi:hypothetical protein